MVTIRLTRRGGKKTPFYHVVVTDSASARAARASRASDSSTPWLAVRRSNCA